MGFLSKVSILRCFYGYTQHHKSIFRGDTNEWLMNTPAKTSSIVLVARLTSVGAAGELSRRSRPVEVLPCMLRAKLQTMSSTSSQPIGGSFDCLPARESYMASSQKHKSQHTSFVFLFFFLTLLLSSFWTSRGHGSRLFFPPGSCLQFYQVLRIGFSNPTARRFFMECC